MDANILTERNHIATCILGRLAGHLVCEEDTFINKELVLYRIIDAMIALGMPTTASQSSPSATCGEAIGGR